MDMNSEKDEEEKLEENLKILEEFLSGFTTYRKEMKEDFNKLVPILEKQNEELMKLMKKHMEELGQARDNIKSLPVVSLVEQQLAKVFMNLVEMEKSFEEMKASFEELQKM